jgi:two-component system sensor histidine kinase ChvG
MPDASGPAALPQNTRSPRERKRVSPLLRRILLVNMVAPALLAASLLYLDQYQTWWPIAVCARARAAPSSPSR